MKIVIAVNQYLRYLHSLGRSSITVKKARYVLNDFLRNVEEEDVQELSELTAEVLAWYQEELSYRLTAKGKPLALRTQGQMLCTVKGFTRFLKEQDYLVYDPGSKIKLPKKPKRLPKHIMDLQEVKKLLNGVNTRTNRGYRNRIVLEILYDTAIRRTELALLMLMDLDLDGGFIHIRSGKGNKERVVPLSTRVCGLLNNYLQFIRPAMLGSVPDEGYLILNRWGKGCTPTAIYGMVRSSCKEAGITKSVSTHTFRHSCATHMLKNGAPIRHIQEMLGHESLESTQIYTKVTISDLKKIHARHHPGEKL